MPAYRTPGPSVQMTRIGTNVVVNMPAPRQSGILMLPIKLEVIYGNFATTDPKEVPFFVLGSSAEPPTPGGSYSPAL